MHARDIFDILETPSSIATEAKQAEVNVNDSIADPKKVKNLTGLSLLSLSPLSLLSLSSLSLLSLLSLSHTHTHTHNWFSWTLSGGDEAKAESHRLPADAECIVKMYDSREQLLKVCDVAEFIGVLTRDPFSAEFA